MVDVDFFPLIDIENYDEEVTDVDDDEDDDDDFDPQREREDFEPDSSGWGKSMWRFLHIYSFSYPEIPSELEKENALKFITSISHALPCSSCRKHCRKYCNSKKKLNDALKSREDMVAFFYDFHSAVNKRLGKDNITLQDCRDMYSDDGPDCPNAEKGWKLLFFSLFL